MKYKCFLFFNILILASCQEYERMTGIKTRELTQVTYNQATVQGTVDDLSGLPHEAYGFCYGTKEVPTIADSLVQLGSSPKVGDFDAQLKKLNPMTTYYVCAFIKEGDSYIYGKTIRFETTSAPVPVLTVIAPSNISYTSAVFGGLIQNFESDTIIESGLCWGISQNPTINDRKLMNTQHVNPFQYAISGLNAGTTYYGRAYATNKSGIGYSENAVIQTLPFALPAVSTGLATDIMDTSAVCWGTIVSIGDGQISEIGIIYGTTANLNGADNDTAVAPSYSYTTEIARMIWGLEPATVYYYRAYAKNFGGYGMGEIMSFTTLDHIDLPSISFTTIEDFFGMGVKCVAFLNSMDGGVEEAGFAWSTTNPNPEKLDGSHSYGFIEGESFRSEISYSYFIPNTNYYFRAYAKNKAGIGYSETRQYTTLEPQGPAVSSIKVYRIHATSAFVIGSEDPWPGYNSSTSGLCWNTTGNPLKNDGVSQVISDISQAASKYTEGKMDNLLPQTTYYVKVWGENSNGIRYGNELTFTTLADNEVLKDYEGNEYTTVKIGTQTWMQENLISKKYRDGTTIQNVFIYNYDDRNIDYWGIHYPSGSAIYNSTLDACPMGWHVPTKAEWETLATYAGGTQVAGNHLKEAGEIHWYGNNMGDNSTGFTATGTAAMINGDLESPTVVARYWSSTLETTNVNWSIYLFKESPEMKILNLSNTGNAFSIRCIKN
jgi:uncharacterized protein (TIGR02145 family)